LNLVSLILEGESAIVEEMNGLGNSKADNARYDVLKETRESLYKECVPILEKLIGISQNQEAIKTLMNIYGTLGDNEGFMRMKGMVEKIIKNKRLRTLYFRGFFYIIFLMIRSL